MKLVIDEKLKHRLVGLSVVLSLGAIFLPAMIKKSSQRLENNFSVNVQLPPKPKAPNVVMTHEKELFKTIKVANIKMPQLPDQKGTHLSKEELLHSSQASIDAAPSAQIEPERSQDADAVAKPIELALSNAAKNAVKRPTKVATHPALNRKSIAIRKPIVVKTRNKPIIETASKRPMVAQTNKRTVHRNGVYAVQLASFSNRNNAQALVSKLQRKGYKANYIKITTKNGVSYKVYAGHSPIKSDVMKLKTQLATAMQLSGFVVTTGVS